MKDRYEIIAVDRDYIEYWFNGKYFARKIFYVEGFKKAEKFFRKAKEFLCGEVQVTIYLNKIEFEQGIPTTSDDPESRWIVRKCRL